MTQNITSLSSFTMVFLHMSDMENEIQESVNHDLNSNDSKTIVIGSGVRIEGKIDGAINSDISGTFNGKIKSDSINISSSGILVGCLLYTSDAADE